MLLTWINLRMPPEDFEYELKIVLWSLRLLSCLFVVVLSFSSLIFGWKIFTNFHSSHLPKFQLYFPGFFGISPRVVPRQPVCGRGWRPQAGDEINRTRLQKFCTKKQ